MTTTTADHHAPNNMSNIDFSGLTPPRKLVDDWSYGTMDPSGGGGSLQAVATCAARWGAQYAAEQLAGRWPEPITDRPPTEADADGSGYVQSFNLMYERWSVRDWRFVADNRDPWRHTPQWKPKAQPPHPADTLAAIIRDVDGNHTMGAAQLAEALLAHPDIRRTLEVKP